MCEASLLVSGLAQLSNDYSVLQNNLNSKRNDAFVAKHSCCSGRKIPPALVGKFSLLQFSARGEYCNAERESCKVRIRRLSDDMPQGFGLSVVKLILQGQPS